MPEYAAHHRSVGRHTFRPLGTSMQPPPPLASQTLCRTPNTSQADGVGDRGGGGAHGATIGAAGGGGVTLQECKQRNGEFEAMCFCVGKEGGLNEHAGWYFRV